MTAASSANKFVPLPTKILFAVYLKINVFVEHRFIDTKMNVVCISKIFVHRKINMVSKKNLLAKAVNSICSSATECGGEMECNQNRCVCNPNQHQDTTTDYLGRTIEYCRSYGMIVEKTEK